MLAPGPAGSRQRRPAPGFTLVELLVVIVIIGILIAGALLTLGSSGGDSQLEQERDRLVALIDYARERGELQTREYGLRCTPSSYQFVVYDDRTRQWLADELDEVLRPRQLPAGLGLSLAVEGRTVVLSEDQEDPGLKNEVQELTPQIMLFSNGDLNDFELTLARTELDRSVTLRNDQNNTISVGNITEQPR